MNYKDYIKSASSSMSSNPTLLSGAQKYGVSSKETYFNGQRGNPFAAFNVKGWRDSDEYKQWSESGSVDPSMMYPSKSRIDGTQFNTAAEAIMYDRWLVSMAMPGKTLKSVSGSY